MVIVSGLCALIKSQQDTDSNNSYIEELRKSDLEPVAISALSFQYINSDDLLNYLLQFDKFGGIIFTSPRVVKAIANALDQCNEVNKDEILSNWRKKKNFAVGETTTNIAMSMLQFICSGQKSGNAKALVSLILEQIHPPTLPFLYPCSNLAKDDISSLNNHNIGIEKIIAYETIPHPLLHESIEDLIKTKGIPEIWIFFSPSGVKYLFPILSSLNILNDLIKFVAIGSSTEEALRQMGVIPWCVAQKPNAQSLTEAIVQARNV